MFELYASHQDIESSMRRAREWCITQIWRQKKVSDSISKCDACCIIGPLINHDTPDLLWAKIATDLFEFKHKDFVVTKNYSTITSAVLLKIKGHRHRNADEIVSDQGLQFTSVEFQQSCHEYGIWHTATSPYHQANGKAEAAVKQAKRIFKMSKIFSCDPHLALLDFWNTPQAGHVPSPAQRLMSRRTKTILPTFNSLTLLLMPHKNTSSSRF